MTFRASNVIPEDGYNRARNIALSLKDYCVAKSAAMNSNMPANDILAIIARLKQAHTDLSAIAAISGISDYAKDQEVDPTYDVVAEFTSLMSAVNSAMTSMVSALPVDGSGYLLIVKINAGALEYRQFTPAQMATAKANLETIIGLIS